jgi:hypothetical protein
VPTGRYDFPIRAALKIKGNYNMETQAAPGLNPGLQNCNSPPYRRGYRGGRKINNPLPSHSLLNLDSFFEGSSFHITIFAKYIFIPELTLYFVFYFNVL